MFNKIVRLKLHLKKKYSIMKFKKNENQLSINPKKFKQLMAQILTLNQQVIYKEKIDI